MSVKFVLLIYYCSLFRIKTKICDWTQAQYTWSTCRKC